MINSTVWIVVAAIVGIILVVGVILAVLYFLQGQTPPKPIPTNSFSFPVFSNALACTSQQNVSIASWLLIVNPTPLIFEIQSGLQSLINNYQVDNSAEYLAICNYIIDPVYSLQPIYMLETYITIAGLDGNLITTFDTTTTVTRNGLTYTAQHGVGFFLIPYDPEQLPAYDNVSLVVLYEGIVKLDVIEPRTQYPTSVLLSFDSPLDMIPDTTHIQGITFNKIKNLGYSVTTPLVSSSLTP